MAQFGTAQRKRIDEVQIVSAEGFPSMGNVHYLDRLAEFHEDYIPQTYLEIGSESGASLLLANCTSFAVDPTFKFEGDVVGAKPQLNLFQGTSDIFFDSDMLGKLGAKLDMAFLDGMHLIEYLLRDFINTEKHMSPKGRVLIHDCVPFNFPVAERVWDKKKTKSWTGDVWKIIPILKQYRPDLVVSILDAPPTGLVLIENLDPKNKALSENYYEILKQYVELELADYGLEKFTTMVGSLKIGDTTAVKRRKKTPASARKALQIALKLPIPNKAEQKDWGEFNFATGLASAFERQGCKVRMDPMDEWDNQRQPDDIDLVLRAHSPYVASDANPTFLWILYCGHHPITAPELNATDHVWCASRRFGTNLARKLGRPAPLSYLPQGFDGDIMRLPEVQATKPDTSLVFVGNNHSVPEGETRLMVKWALASGQPLKIWGRGWEGTAAEKHVVGNHLDPEEVAEVYQNCGVVLNDHMHQMGRRGFVSNRLYDALACGAPAVTDPVNGLPSHMAPYLRVCLDEETFAVAVKGLLAKTETNRGKRQAFAQSLAKTDSFDARAESLLRDMNIALAGK